MNRHNFSPAQIAMLELFKDGEQHSTKEVREVLPKPDSQDKSYVANHILKLRQKLEVRRETIVCSKYRGVHYYRWVRLITTAE